MKHYYNPANDEIFAYEDDGSQDHLINPTFISIEGDALQVLRDKNQQKITEQAQKEYDAIPAEQKLASFLSANPDVLKLVTQQS